MKLGIVGFPGLYGGAGTELDAQMTLWQEMGWELHVVPTFDVTKEPLLGKTLHRAKVHDVLDYSALKGMPVISFCNDAFLRDIKKIKEYASKTYWVNCMTWLFEAEKAAHKEGLIDLFLYHTDITQAKVSKALEELNTNYNWKLFHSWFDDKNFPYHQNRATDKFRFGRVSREDADKYAGDSLWVYETMVAPVLKSGIMLGFDKRSEGKVGKPPDWIRTYPACGITQQEFYAHCAVIIQKADTFENWPRVGMEAMASGAVLVVDNRGGWTRMIDNKVTGFLCNDAREFVYCASRLAYEPDERNRMAELAREKGKELFGKEKAKKSWKEVFEVC